MDWYQTNQRSLPWRGKGVTPWQILVSEIMLQQTPANRVAPAWQQWIDRWPDAQSLASAKPADVLRQWDRLGYPKRALRLQATARELVNHHNGQLPQDLAALTSLPGIGEYTAAAVLAFAFKKKAVVLDTNVRRVISRIWHGQERTATHLTNVERTFAAGLLPETDDESALWSIAIMEFGALVCTARQPKCDACIVSTECAWLNAGCPTSAIEKRTQKFTGTDRQVRGKILELMRASAPFVSEPEIMKVWPDEVQLNRALKSLMKDGLVVQNQHGTFQLPD